MSSQVEFACPTCGEPLSRDGDGWACTGAHTFPEIERIPILIALHEKSTHPAVARMQETFRGDGDFSSAVRRAREIDPLRFVHDNIVGTHGNLYRRVSRMARLPLPYWPTPLERESIVVDVGGHWGRWGLAAARAGAQAVVVEPDIEAVLVGRRIAEELGLRVEFVVGDARRLPLAPDQADVVFSYSVLQHFSKEDACRILAEMAGVARPGGRLLVQLPNRFGLRQMINRARQVALRDENPFRVRYWGPVEMQEVMEDFCEEVSLRIDGFFALNPRAEDADLLPAAERAVVTLSSLLTRLGRGRLGRTLTRVADSLWVEGTVSVGDRIPV